MIIGEMGICTNIYLEIANNSGSEQSLLHQEYRQVRNHTILNFKLPSCIKALKPFI